MDKLSDFVNEQIREGVKPTELKGHLLRNGWRENEVDSAISSAVGRRVRRKITFAFIGLAIIAILALSLISLTKPEEIKPNYIPTTNANPNVDFKNQNTVNSCESVEDSVEKNECYKKFVSTGLDCRKINDDVENTFCTRAQEEMLLKGIDTEDISEN